MKNVLIQIMCFLQKKSSVKTQRARWCFGSIAISLLAAYFPLVEASEPYLFEVSFPNMECSVIEDDALAIIRGKHTGPLNAHPIVIDGVSVILWDEVGGGKPPQPDTQINVGGGGLQNNRVLMRQ